MSSPTRIAIQNILNNLELPKLIYKVETNTDQEIVFTADLNYKDIEVVDAASYLVNLHYKNCTEVVKHSSRYFLEIEHKQLDSRMSTTAWNAIVEIWLTVNNKKNFRRSALYRKAYSALNTSFKFNDLLLELYADAYKYGLMTNTISKPIKEFIAKQFEKGVNDLCQR